MSRCRQQLHGRRPQAAAHGSGFVGQQRRHRAPEADFKLVILLLLQADVDKGCAHARVRFLNLLLAPAWTYLAAGPPRCLVCACLGCDASKSDALLPPHHMLAKPIQGQAALGAGSQPAGGSMSAPHRSVRPIGTVAFCGDPIYP